MRMAARTTTAADPVLQTAIDRIVAGFDPLRIILFGSRARGDQRPDSDYDLLVVLDEVGDHFATTAAVMDVLADMRMAKDIIVAEASEVVRGGASGSVLSQALSEGRTVYESG